MVPKDIRKNLHQINCKLISLCWTSIDSRELEHNFGSKKLIVESSLFLGKK